MVMNAYLEMYFFSSRLRENLMFDPMLDQNRLKFIGENGQIKVYAVNKLIFKANLEQVRIPEDSKVIETPNVRFQKPQQSNKEAVLASPGLKFSDYELVENGNDVDEDETVNNIPVSLRKNSETENEVGKALIVP
ncbi:UNVERIFIED_CONTAM: hypothetical protein NCL1_39160 [Trichonephila clavipes]